MNWTHTKYQFLNNGREPAQIFWTVAYPILMALMFYLAFQGLLSPEPMNIRIAVAEGSGAGQVLKDIDFLDISEMSEARALDLIREGDLTGFVDAGFDVTVNGSGLKESVLTSVTGQIKQMQALNVPFENYDFEASYIETASTTANPFLIPFYSLIGMVSLYSVYLGLEFSRIIQADQSTEAQRLNVVPLKKTDFLSGSMLTGIVMNLLSNALLLVFFRYVLRMDLVSDYPRTLLLLLAANILGMGLGLFIGASNNFGDGVKTAMVISSTLFMAFLSGMMSPDIKVIIDNNLPLLSRLNPVNVVTSEMYRVNYLGLTSTYSAGVLTLLAIALALIGASLMFLRRKTYDSI